MGLARNELMTPSVKRVGLRSPLFARRTIFLATDVAMGASRSATFNRFKTSSVSVRKHFESFESFVIQSGDLIREGHHRCGRRRTADVTTAANCDIRVT